MAGTVGCSGCCPPAASGRLTWGRTWTGTAALPGTGGPRRIIAEVEAAGLTGRGGAAFPTYRKLAAAAGCTPAPVVAGNGAEGEPASSKDRSLLWISPHLVLDGLQVAAEAAGSPAAVLYVRRGRRLHERLALAIAERAAVGIGTATVELREAPDRFLAGEESAVASRLAGPRCPATGWPAACRAPGLAVMCWCRTSRPWPTWR